MNSEFFPLPTAQAELEQRLAALAQSKSRLEVINRLLMSLSSVAGLDNMVQHILDILMQTIGAANISVVFGLNGTWQLRDTFGTSREFAETDHPGIRTVLTGGRPLRVKDPSGQVPYPGATGTIATEIWIFPLRSKERTIGAVCLDGMQLTDQGIFEELRPFFVYAGLMLDNEIANYSQLADAHRRLLESETLYRTLFEQSPDGIVLWSVPELRPLQFNPSAHTMLGYSVEEFSALAGGDFQLGADPEAKGLPLETLRLEGACSFEAVHRTKTGDRLTMSITAKMVDLAGRRLILAIHRDITERQRALEEQRRLEAQLLHAQKLESLGVLAGGIAHDFNNILMAILGNAGLALMRLNQESPAVDNLRKIEQAAARAADLAKQMLAYSGKGKFVVEPLDLNRLLEEMLHMLEVSISKKAVLRLNLKAHLPAVEADATQIRQIVMNLVINASEAIGEKSGIIALTTGCMDCDGHYLRDVWLDEKIGEGRYVYLEIADTGCGMDRETLARIFDPFFTTKFTGRGLGMAAVLGIVRGHRGAIKVYSEVGKGTTFKVLLPAGGRPAEDGAGVGHSEAWQGGGTVLLVDDEETVRGIGAEMLKELGLTVITANDGREALALCRTNPDLALVILDLTMPHMDGEECYRELRQIRPDLKVIMSSGYNEQEVTQKFLGKGLAGFLQKPYTLSSLKKTLRGILQGSGPS